MADDPVMAVERAVDRLRGTGLATEATLDGCSPAEIRAIERELGVTLPAAYVAFLERAGRSAGDFLVGSDFRGSDVVSLTEGLVESVDEHDATADLTDETVAFVGHQGYVYLYFTADGPDPPVYRYVAGDPASERVFDAVTDWLRAAVADEASG